MNPGVVYGIGSAVLFGISTPVAKVLLGSVPPLLLAGLLYAGAGVGLLVVLGVRVLKFGSKAVVMPAKREWGWLAGAIVLGGLMGPVALMFGLTTTTAASASLLLNLEAVLTALLAWFLFRENFDARIALGMVAIVAGGCLIAWAPGAATTDGTGPLLITLACLCWALDNNLTRKVSASDPVLIACLKGVVAGTVNGGLALLLLGTELPPVSSTWGAAAVGFLGYGVSLVLFVLALRHLGSARAGAYFSVAPFFGAAVALMFHRDPLTWQLASAGVLMAIGVWLHVTERHRHVHTHERFEHSHSHHHDRHHEHIHAFDWDGQEPHSHSHAHGQMTHSHEHYPDLHHRHRH